MCDAVVRDKWLRFHPWMDRHEYLKRYEIIVRRNDKKVGPFGRRWRQNRFEFARELLARDARDM